MFRFFEVFAYIFMVVDVDNAIRQQSMASIDEYKIFGPCIMEGGKKV